MTRVILVHGFGATPQLYWLPWLAQELRNRNIQVIAPTLPHPFRPVLSEWVDTLRNTIGTIDDNTIIVTHSLGTAAVMHLLQELPQEQQCKAFIAVAPLVLPRYGKLFDTFFDNPINATQISHHAKSLIVLHDPADRWAPFSNAKFLSESCGATVVECPHRHHFNALTPAESVPEILEAVLRLV